MCHKPLGFLLLLTSVGDPYFEADFEGSSYAEAYSDDFGSDGPITLQPGGQFGQSMQFGALSYLTSQYTFFTVNYF